MNEVAGARSSGSIVAALLAIVLSSAGAPSPASAQGSPGAVLEVKQIVTRGGVTKAEGRPDPGASVQLFGHPRDRPDRTARKDDPVEWNDTLLVERDFRVHIRLQLGTRRRDRGNLAFMPEIRTDTGKVVWDAGGSSDQAEYEFTRLGDVTRVIVRRGAVIAKDLEAQEAAFQVCAAGKCVMNVPGGTRPVGDGGDLSMRGPTAPASLEDQPALAPGARRWSADQPPISAALFAEVDPAGVEAGLVVVEGTVLITSDGSVPGDTTSIVVHPSRTMYTWRQRSPGVVARSLSAADLRLWTEGIEYNGDEVWKGGGFPWIVVPAAAVPVVLCAILCGGGDDGGGKTGTVTIPIP